MKIMTDQRFDQHLERARSDGAMNQSPHSVKIFDEHCGQMDTFHRLEMSSANGEWSIRDKKS